MKKKTICFPHSPSKIGGPASFQTRLINEMKNRNWEICYPNKNKNKNIILVIGGTSKLCWLLLQKIKGTKIILRLDGINWAHKLKLSRMRIKTRIKAELQNQLIKLIFKYFCDFIVYQSNFAKNIWEKRMKAKKNTIIYNSVDTKIIVNSNPSNNRKPKLLCVEGSISDSNFDFNTIIDLCNELTKEKRIHEFIIIGRISDEDRLFFNAHCQQITFKGVLERNEVLKYYPNSLFLSMDINAACPNTVIESMASGSPVIGYNTGALCELVTPDSGVLADYVTDPWNLDKPNSDNLILAAKKVLDDWKTFSNNARNRAVHNFDINDMTDKYINVFEQHID